MIGNQQQTPEDILRNHGRLLVRRAIERDDEVTNAIFEIATAGRAEWTHTDAMRLVNSLEECDLTINQWLATQL